MSGVSPQIPRDDSVELWSPDGRFGLRVPNRILVRLLRLCELSNTRETGGILVGRYTDARNCALITDMSPPPKDSKSGRAWFARGVHGLQVWLDRLWRSVRHYYVGEWHFHPGGPSSPSDVDSQQMHAIARSLLYQCPEPILFILGGDTKVSWTIGAYVYPRAEDRIELARTSPAASGSET